MEDNKTKLVSETNEVKTDDLPKDNTEETVTTPEQNDSAETAQSDDTSSAETASAENVQSDEAPSKDSIEPQIADASFAGKNCPYCKTEIQAGDEIVVCNSCNTPHHKGCWEENKGCTTFGCAGYNYEERNEPQSNTCTNCGAVLGEGELFCTKCGTPAPKEPEKKNVCGKCGAEIQEGQEFCSKCGQKVGLVVDPEVNSAISKFNSDVQKKKVKTKPIIIIAVSAVVLIGIIIGIVSIVSANKKAEEKKKFMSNAKSFYSEVLSSGALLESVGSTIKDYWYTYIYDNGYYIEKYSSVDDAVSSAQYDESSNISDIESADSTISSLYSKLSKNTEPELDSIKDSVEDVYEAYKDMYNCVIDVSGNYSTYSTTYNECDSNLSTALSKLENKIN